MKPEETLREHFKLMRKATEQAMADYHFNVIYGYLLGLRETQQITFVTYRRLIAIATKAWGQKIDRIYGLRRVA